MEGTSSIQKQIESLIKYNFLQQSMNTHPLRSCHARTGRTANPSNRIDLLYSQFQSLKTRIRSNSNTRTNQESKPTTTHHIQLGHHDSIYSHFDLQLQRKGKSQVNYGHEKEHKEGNMNSSTFICNEDRLDQFKKQKSDTKVDPFNVVDIVNKSGLCQLESIFKKKIDNFQGKIGVCEEMVRGIATLLKMRKNAKEATQRPRKKSFMSQSPTREKQVVQVIQQYEDKIQRISKQYETRIRELEKENSKNSSTCESKVGSKFFKQANEFQSLLLARDNEISLLKIENSKLRRANDKLQQNFTSQLKLIAHLESHGQQQVFRKDEETIRQLQLKIKQLERMLEEKNQQSQVLRNSHKRQKAMGSLEDIMDESQKEIVEDIDFEQGLTISQLEECKSQILDTRKLKKYKNMKSLEVEIDLITQENKNLEIKKHFLENQNKAIEEDQERFQQQSNILKQQIRNLNSCLGILDEATVTLLRGGELKRERIQKLGGHLKCKPLLFQKVDRTVVK